MIREEQDYKFFGLKNFYVFFFSFRKFWILVSGKIQWSRLWIQSLKIERDEREGFCVVVLFWFRRSYVSIFCYRLGREAKWLWSTYLISLVIFLQSFFVLEVVRNGCQFQGLLEWKVVGVRGKKDFILFFWVSFFLIRCQMVVFVSLFLFQFAVCRF